MDYRCRQLTPRDTDSLKTLLNVFAKAFGDPATYQSAVPSDEYLTNFLSKSENIVITAIAENEIIGGLVAYELAKFEQDRREMYIYDLAVAEEHRRQGVATGLIQELQDVARERKAYLIFVQADQGDQPAIKLYESLGRQEEVYQFDIPVHESNQ